MRKICTVQLLVLPLLLAAAPALKAQCATFYQWPRWVWQDLQYVDTTGYDGDFDYAIYGWETQEGGIAFEQYIEYEDLLLGGVALPNGIVANTVPHTEMENSGCANKTDYCGICMDAAVFYWAELQFDESQLSAQYQIYQAEGYVQTFDQVMTQAMSHELGHVLREADLGLS